MPGAEAHDLIYQSATKLAALMRERLVSPVEAVDAHIARIEAVNPRINAFCTTAFDSAREHAHSSEQRLARGEAAGPLEGVPVSVKDNIETAGIRTVAGSRLRESVVPARDAEVVARLKRAGAIILGKTNMPEFGFDFVTDNPVFGRTCNPWDLGRVPGGSSGGEAAAIASGCSAAGIGNDLGGSIRVPAHFCGITGLKPTPGRIPTPGHVPPALGPFGLGMSAGPMARSVEDLVLLFSALAGFHAGDAASVPLPVRDPRRTETRGLRVMLYTDDGISPVTAATRQAVERAAAALADRGLPVIEQRPHGLERAFDLWFTWLGESGVPGILSLYEGREELMGPLMRGLKAMARPLDMERFLRSWAARDMLRGSVVAEMMEHPILLAPVTAIPAFPHGHRGDFDVEGKPVEYLKVFSYTEAYNLLGLPAAVVPAGRSPEGLPIGVQIIGRPFEDEMVLAVAALLEESLGGFERPPI